MLGGGTPSLGVRLLGDLRTVFGDSEHMLTVSILEALNGIDEAPWGDLRGKPLDFRGLSRRLSKYDVHPHTVRIGSVVGKGYSRADLGDPWRRYLEPECNRVTAGSDERVKREEGVSEQSDLALDTPRKGSVTSVTSDTGPNGTANCDHCREYRPTFHVGTYLLCRTCADERAALVAS
ncbi:MAG TPA: DUF3631 domain-containing protein [Candidatus Saccharimonadales bacterium]|nr:DUF3631 domain-containing protein [Candidatus Saccharimonadales bacterium]